MLQRRGDVTVALCRRTLHALKDRQLVRRRCSCLPRGYLRPSGPRAAYSHSASVGNRCPSLSARLLDESHHDTDLYGRQRLVFLGLVVPHHVPVLGVGDLVLARIMQNVLTVTACDAMRRLARHGRCKGVHGRRRACTDGARPCTDGARACTDGAGACTDADGSRTDGAGRARTVHGSARTVRRRVHGRCKGVHGRRRLGTDGARRMHGRCKGVHGRATARARTVQGHARMAQGRARTVQARARTVRAVHGRRHGRRLVHGRCKACTDGARRVHGRRQLVHGRCNGGTDADGSCTDGARQCTDRRRLVHGRCKVMRGRCTGLHDGNGSSEQREVFAVLDQR